VSDGGGRLFGPVPNQRQGSSTPIGASWIMRDFLFWTFCAVGALAAIGTFVLMGFFLVSVLKG
jgi:hypothetical protein